MNSRCGDCGGQVQRYGHEPGCHRVKVLELRDLDKRLAEALESENRASPGSRHKYVVHVGWKAERKRNGEWVD